MKWLEFPFEMLHQVGHRQRRRQGEQDVHMVGDATHGHPLTTQRRGLGCDGGVHAFTDAGV